MNFEFIAVLLISFAGNVVQGGFPANYLLPIDGVDGVVIVDLNNVLVNEELPDKDDPDPYNAFRIIVDGPEKLEIQWYPPEAYQFSISENAENEWYFALNTTVDFENPEAVKSFSVNVTHNDQFKVITLSIVDINDNPVRIDFISPDTIEPIDEFSTEEVGKTLVSVHASDPDAIDQGQLRYGFSHTYGSQPDPIFSMDLMTGELTLLRALNYSESPMHRLNLYVNDSDNKHTDEWPITINVIDLPNQPPEFIGLPASISVEENTDLNSLKARVRAQDQDLGVGWPIRYEWEELHNQPDPFLRIDENTGEIFVDSEIDAELFLEQEGSLVFTAKVRAIEVPHDEDDEDLALSAEEEISITITDKNDERPKVCKVSNPSYNSPDCAEIQRYTISLPENSVGTLDLNDEFTVVDWDSTNEFSKYTIAFDDSTDPLILEAFTVQPVSSSGMTQISVIVRNSRFLDYEYKDPTSQEPFWYSMSNGIPSPQPHVIRVKITGVNDPTHIAHAEITLTLTDLNDNEPTFDIDTLTVKVCERAENNAEIKALTLKPGGNPDLCRDYTPAEAFQIRAQDNDVSPEFRNFRFSFDPQRAPPVTLNSVTGEMIINLNEGTKENFDRERFPVEVFTILVTDRGDEVSDDVLNGRGTLTFQILDKNDAPVDLRLPQSRISIYEGNDLEGDEILVGIEARDADLLPDIDVYIKTDQSRRVLKGSNVSVPLQNDSPNNWFAIRNIRENENLVKSSIIINVETIDREFEGTTERIDLVIAAIDRNSEFPNEDAEVTQTLVITILDINDNPPEWEDIGEEGVTVEIQETDRFPSEGDGTTPAQREIYVFRARDADDPSNTRFEFSYEATGCLSDNLVICKEYLNLVELEQTEGQGKATLRRRQGVMIDREETKFYNGEQTNNLLYTIRVSDGENQNDTQILINIEDRNDNSPQWENLPAPKSIPEHSPNETPVATFFATDEDRPDRYGLVTYRLPQTTPDNAFFTIDLEDGILKTNVLFDWSQKKSYSLTIEAFDNYRPDLTTDSNTNAITYVVTIEDDNDNAPDFVTPTEGFLDEPLETKLTSGYELNATINVIDLDDPEKGNGIFDVVVTQVIFKDKNGEEHPLPPDQSFMAGPLRPPNCQADCIVPIIARKDFRGFWGEYDVTFTATDKGTPDAKHESATYTIKVQNENLNAPIFTSPVEGLPLVVSINSVVGQPLMNDKGNEVEPCTAEDDDDPETDNSQFTFTAIEPDEGEDLEGWRWIDVVTVIDPDRTIKGRFILKEQLPADKTFLYLKVLAQDKGSPSLSSNMTVKFYLHPDFNRPPVFEDSSDLQLEIMENKVLSTPIERPVADEDNFLPEYAGDKVYYSMLSGNTTLFSFVHNEATNETFINTLLPLDRETEKFYNICVLVSNYEEAPPIDDSFDCSDHATNSSILSIHIEVGNEFDTPPSFGQRSIISGGFSLSSLKEEVLFSVTVEDLDDFDDITFTNSQFTPSDPTLFPTDPFLLQKRSDSNLTIDFVMNFNPTGEMKGFYTFNLTAVDRGELRAEIPCKIYMIKDTNWVDFRFLNLRSQIDPIKDALGEGLSYAFGYQCNVGLIREDDGSSVNTTTVRTHFIDLTTNEPIQGVVIEDAQFQPDVYFRLSERLTELGLILAQNGIGNGSNDGEDESNLAVYLLIGGVALLTVLLAVLGTTCFFNNRSLSRRVRALTATTFGSQESGLNRVAGAVGLPNTNEFAIEGSNPMWAKSPEPEGNHYQQKPIAPDAESVGSGGSVLIGVEDDEDFRNYRERDNANGFGGAAGFNSNSNSEDEYDPVDPVYDDNHDRNQYQKEGQELELGGPPPGFGDGSMRRNPLAGLDFGEDDDGAEGGDFY